MSELSNLNRSQLKAVRHGKGPMLVLAGPGSGKTMVIVHRISYLIERSGISPENILVVTFSRAAAREMKKRFNERMRESGDPARYEQVTFGTVHSVFLHILSSFYDIKKDQISYDDMLILTYELLLKRPDVLKYWQNKYRYILVDEFQDISHIQYDTLNLLAGDAANIFVVGDDDQSIYGFRGADPGVLRKFVKDHKKCRRVLLNVNYRCNKKIMKRSLALISLNNDRFDKRIKAYTRRRIKNCVRLKTFEDNEDEFEFIANEIAFNISRGKCADDIALLFRNHHDYALLLKIFEKKNIAYNLKNAEPDHESIKDENAPLDGNEFLIYNDHRTHKISDPSIKTKSSNCGVNIMTMHASKGLEFDTVYLPCLNEGIIPGKKAKSKAAICEERRLMYVAMTRAKNHLLLSYSNHVCGKLKKPSEFLDNMLL